MDINAKNPKEIRETITKCLRFILPADSPFPADDDDWIAGGLLDSMEHVDLLLAIERALGAPNWFGKEGAAPPRTIRSATEIIIAAWSRAEFEKKDEAAVPAMPEEKSACTGLIRGWATSLGGIAVPSNLVDEEFGLPPGTLKARAGIETLRRATPEEDEISLAGNAAHAALQKSGCSTQELDWILATSETLQGFPSFAARMHISLLAPQSCRTIDVGGGCVGIPKCFSIAQGLISLPGTQNILIVSADVHSRILIPGKIPGEFGGLFGDGACAFLISRDPQDTLTQPYSILLSVGGCAGMYSSTLRLHWGGNESIELEFRGEALAQAAIDLMEKTLAELEIRSGKNRKAAGAFALHQPNHRVAEILIRCAGLPHDKAPFIAKTCGNLGASTCGAALVEALDRLSEKEGIERGAIFLAAVAPGILWDGVLLD
jgi:3-oxoacyl-[acyl-carrier-protein] synthase-3